MKTSKLLVMLLFGLFACTGQRMVVDADKNLDADFNEYQTYYWASSVNDDSNLDFWLNNASLKEQVREAVKYELDARGYKMQEENPDLLVNFRIFDEDTEFKGYTGVGTEGYWGTGVNDAVREEDDARIYNFEEGTLLIDLVDADKSTLVWQGYASGVIEDQVAYDEEEDKIRDAVQMIFNEYGYRADAGGTQSEENDDDY